MSLWDGPKNTIIEARNYILFVIILFTAGLIYGYVNLQDNQHFYEIFQNLLKTHQAKSYFPYIIKIFVRNSIVAYISMRFGIFLGIFPTFSSFFNGLMVGWLKTTFEKISGFNLFLLLLPHGIFELSAMFIAWGIGIWRVKLLFVPNFEEAAKVSLKRIHKVYVTVILPLLLIAAVIEGRAML
ncbi:MAG: stage II sporulation protein M [Deltaproteobacteria bacterium]|nr:stage II sporulation protein M [Deltaproteobacteria bacterium]MBW1848803.1 stage II sporulation protein M [Deltaproteobacteria bacterium]MBW2180853.1 stage II sporulation protein M [Deltaproteobacteria bacterium]MBW2365632.1 stage II sporulation protein M [Deltaproteobacteria bacterium]